MKTIKFIATTFFLWIGFLIPAQTASNADLVQLVKKAFKYNPRISELQQNVQIQEARFEVAKTYLLPSVSATGSYNYIAPVGMINFPVGPGVEKQIQFQPNNNITFGLGLNYLLFDFGRARANINKTKIEIEQSKDNVEFNKAMLAAQVADIYFGILYLKSAIVVEDSILSSLAQTKTQTENKFKNGDALELDLLTISSNIDAEENRRVELNSTLEKQKSLLLHATGENEITQTSVDFNFVAPTIPGTVSDELVKQAEQNNIDFKMLQQRKLLTAQDWNINKRNYYPAVNVLGNAGMRNGYQPDINPLRFNYLVGLSFNAPLFQGGRYTKQKRLFDATAALNELSLTTLRKNYQRDISQALIDISAYSARLANVQGQIQQAEKAMLQTKIRYKNGIALQIEYTSALTSLQKIKLSGLNFEFQKCLSQVELARLLGTKWW